MGRYIPIPVELFTLELNPIEIAIYIFLLSCEDRKTYTCYPSFHTIAKNVRVSKNTVQKYVRTLCEKQLIETTQTKVTAYDGTVRNGTLLFHILPIQTAVNCLMQKKFALAELERQKRAAQKKLSAS